MTKEKKNRALVMFSGGLDSMLVAKILQEQNLDVTGLVFTSYFFDEEKAVRFANMLGIELVKKNFSTNHLEIIKEPKYGYGKGLNPCIDCHSLMVSEAKKFFVEGGFDVLATGEVLGQRPFSQNKNVFMEMEKRLGLEAAILRPLSAKLLPETIYEQKGLVGREGLYDIENKSRKKQQELAEKFSINEFATPSGGCVLAEPMFAEKVSALMAFIEKPDKRDFDLLRMGRHFWVGEDSDIAAWIVLGRDKEENRELARVKKGNELLILRDNEKGPSALVVFGDNSSDKREDAIDSAKQLIWKYSGKKPDDYKNIKYISYDRREEI